MKESKYEKDGFVFNSKAEYLKWVMISILLIIAWFAMLVISSIYGEEYRVNQCCECLCKENNASQCRE